MKNLALYKKIAENLYSPLTPQDGVSVAEIEEQEKYLGVRLPTVLREFYLLVGKHEAINFSFNRLLTIKNLDLDLEQFNKLFFYEENQGVCYWAIKIEDVAVDNPPVWVGQSVINQEELEWHLAATKLTDFLLIMLCWQSVTGGMPFAGGLDNIEDSVIGRARNNFDLIQVEEEFSGLQAFVKDAKVICFAVGDNETSIYAGAKSEKELIEIEETLEIALDYTSFGN